jgi:hypothetical protein
MIGSSPQDDLLCSLVRLGDRRAVLLRARLEVGGVDLEYGVARLTGRGDDLLEGHT